MYIPIGKHCEMEINFNIWNPLTHIALRRSLDITIYDEDEKEWIPAIWVTLALIFVSFEIYIGKVD